MEKYIYIGVAIAALIWLFWTKKICISINFVDSDRKDKVKKS